MIFKNLFMSETKLATTWKICQKQKNNSKEAPEMVQVRDDESLNWDRLDRKETDIQVAKEWWLLESENKGES